MIHEEPVTPALAVPLPSFAATDPGHWQHLLDRARAADRAGVDLVVVSDHVVLGHHLDAYARPELGGVEGGRQPTGPDGLWLEPLTVLSVVCGLTSRVRLSTNILLAALRRPVVLAKTAATLDVLSGGRLELGVGVGWQREEYEAAGLDFEARGRLLDQTLEVCGELWRHSPAAYSSETLTFDGIHCMPHPVHPSGVPLLVSGTLHQRVLDRIVRFGSGWIPWGPLAADPARGVPVIREALAAAGRDPRRFEVRGTLPVVKRTDGKPDLDKTMARVPALVDAGITQFVAGVAVPRELDAATEYLTEVVAAFRRVVGR